jgi:peptidyl-prolyl cis-trans isomerase C
MAAKVNAAHILVETEKKAKELKERINGGEQFADLAKKYSSCPSGKKGGDLGWFGRGDMVPEFEKAAFTGKVGDVIGPVRTKFGWHLIMVKEEK